MNVGTTSLPLHRLPPAGGGRWIGPDAGRRMGWDGAVVVLRAGESPRTWGRASCGKRRVRDGAICASIRLADIAPTIAINALSSSILGAQGSYPLADVPKVAVGWRAEVGCLPRTGHSCLGARLLLVVCGPSNFALCRPSSSKRTKAKDIP